MSPHRPQGASQVWLAPPGAGAILLALDADAILLALDAAS